MGYVKASPAAELEPTKRDRPLPRGLRQQLVMELLHKLYNSPEELTSSERAEWVTQSEIVWYTSCEKSRRG